MWMQNAKLEAFISVVDRFEISYEGNVDGYIMYGEKVYRTQIFPHLLLYIGGVYWKSQCISIRKIPWTYKDLRRAYATALRKF